MTHHMTGGLNTGRWHIQNKSLLPQSQLQFALLIDEANISKEG
jgi:hypothetical protein